MFINFKSPVACFRTQEKNTSVNIKSDFDRRKDRKRNLVPAKTGFIILILSLFYSVIFSVGYRAFDDSGTRNYFVSVFQDLHTCIVAPGVLVFQAPSVQRKIQKTSLRFVHSSIFNSKIYPTANNSKDKIKEKEQNVKCAHVTLGNK